ncbi:ankyrin repeat and BTB/POZ domain-containing protein 2 [Copidosoma floridanum]|uniref:ankyrin repeat and BTB/POZ domain-containing protein 2 n=1 Tax=Copidosoma floridanum TaxID=29053 RepID=UPI000C6F496B|nr:ankyrin repeat and BTB/POZ domain-containing protein 2 [Copidosoma floridanum]
MITRLNYNCMSDCECILCLELRGSDKSVKTSGTVDSGIMESTRSAGLGCNFILMRPALPFVSREPSREWQEEAASDDSEPAKEPLHRTVVYFGDTKRRDRTTDSGDRLAADAEPSPGIVVSVRPGREDVLRIEQQPHREFKPDWSFVQQWRLKGPSGGGGNNNQEPEMPPRPKPIGSHLSLHELIALQSTECAGSSSDERSSSGHASMKSDGGGHTSGGSPRHQRDLDSVPEQPSSRRHHQDQQQQQHHHHYQQQQPRLGVQKVQSTLRSRTSTTSRSYSSLSGGSESSSAQEVPNCASVTESADEFVFVEARSRLVELARSPWTQADVVRAVLASRAGPRLSAHPSAEVVSRLSYLLQRCLVRLAREVKRLAQALGFAGRREVWAGLRIVLGPGLADSAGSACLRASAMYGLAPFSPAAGQTTAARAGLQLPVGAVMRWMIDARLGRMVHELAAVYLVAALESLLEELVLRSLSHESQQKQQLTPAGLERTVAGDPDFCALLQPFAHLNAGRIANGSLVLPHWSSTSSLSGSGNPPAQLEASLLTTCVGSLRELRELVDRLVHCSRCPLVLSDRAIDALFYYMRCSQLEHGERRGIQELAYERTYGPPLVEWLRVAGAHAEYRHARFVDRDDVSQAARLLLGVDCPARPICSDEVVSAADDPVEYTRRLHEDVGLKLLRAGRPELIRQAAHLPEPVLPDALDKSGLSSLMLAVCSGDEAAVLALLDAGVDPDVESAVTGPHCADAQGWTALTFAALLGHCSIARKLLDCGAAVGGGGDRCAVMPIQAAAAAGKLEMIALLLDHGGAQPFLSTLSDSCCYSGSPAQRGCYSAISVAAAHGHRACLQQLLSHPSNFSSWRGGEKEVLSLEEILAEGTSTQQHQQLETPVRQFSKTQYKVLQEAMYHSVENNHLDITMDLRELGVSWTLHCWMQSLSLAHEMRMDSVVDQLLQDFQVCSDDYSTQFVEKGLPLLFNIFRYNKKEGTILLLADIFSTCFGWEPIKPVRNASLSNGGSRIDPKFVNNPELSDVQFRVEGRVFYGHKIVLVTSSSRFKSMLSSNLCQGNPPIVQINDIRYHIFQMVMEFLYNGGCSNLKISQNDVLELMAAANFFQLDGLLRFCEAQCSTTINLDNIVSMYIHAKVYNASQLLEYCQGFLLQNMVALLTYDDSVKRLIFAKKFPNHDVLNSLLLTLQGRMKAKRPQN